MEFGQIIASLAAPNIFLYFRIDQINNLREIQAMRRLSPHDNIVELKEVLLLVQNYCYYATITWYYQVHQPCVINNNKTPVLLVWSFPFDKRLNCQCLESK